MTSLVIASARRVFCCSDFPGQSLTITRGIVYSFACLKIATESLAVLLVGNLLHPVDHPPILLFLNSDVRHGSGLSCAMPVLLAGREPDHVTGLDFLNRSTFALSPAAASRDDQSLAERMSVPCSSRAWLERNASPLNKSGIGCLKKRIDTNRPSEPL